MIVLITGSSGFIGFHLSNFFLKKGYKVLGLDNHNSYYSKKIKSKRLSFLIKNKKFNFFKTDIADPVKLEKIFYKFILVVTKIFQSLDICSPFFIHLNK